MGRLVSVAGRLKPVLLFGAATWKPHACSAFNKNLLLPMAFLNDGFRVFGGGFLWHARVYRADC